MEQAEALRAIHHDHLEYIQKKVRVDFDNWRQQPVSFTLADRTHVVGAIVSRFKMLTDQLAHGYLVEVSDRDIFCLYYQPERVQEKASVQPGFWVLSFRILNDNELMSWYTEDRKMLANISLKRVVDFHGHICPELAIGGKFCEFVQTRLANGTLASSGLSIIAENTTSALDAIQVLLGVTIGNQRLMFMDYGKHNYTLLSRHDGRGWKLRLKTQCYGDEEIFHILESKINENHAVIEEMVRFQQLLDARVRQILDLTPEDLFNIEETDAETLPRESVSFYQTCSICGEQVLANRCIERQKRIFCMPCFQKETPGCQHFGMQ